MPKRNNKWNMGNNIGRFGKSQLPAWDIDLSDNNLIQNSRNI